jgi:hypothetical protein
MENLQKDLSTLGEWAVEKGMKINLGKSKAMIFTEVGFKSPLGHSLVKKNTGSDQLFIFRNNVWKRFKLGGPRQLDSTKRRKCA